jgi:hypothetical protein
MGPGGAEPWSAPFEKATQRRSRHSRLCAVTSHAGSIRSLAPLLLLSACAAPATPDAKTSPLPRARVHAEGWDACPFPPEADAARVDTASVVVEVRVDPLGKATDVTIIKDPGHGFAAAARACAMKATYGPAVDANGAPTEGSTPAFRVHFTRPAPP